MSKGDWAYRADGTRVFIPDKKVSYNNPTYRYEKLRGYAYTVAAFDANGKCVGWAEVD